MSVSPYYFLSSHPDKKDNKSNTLIRIVMFSGNIDRTCTNSPFIIDILQTTTNRITPDCQGQRFHIDLYIYT